MAGWRHAGRIVFSALFALCVTLQPDRNAHAQAALVPVQPLRIDAAGPLSGFVLEAAHRFDIPESWICAVMQAESGGNANAVSPKGALGLMQLMPATYADMRTRYGLGADPMQPHDNIIAGTAYLREMLDCYGMAGFLAAYNAGPAQYDAHLATGMPLPAETRTYVARLLPVIDGERNAVPANGIRTLSDPHSWQRAPLFVVLGGGMMAADRLQSGGRTNAVSAAGFAALEPATGGHPGGISNNAALFIPVAMTAP